MPGARSDVSRTLGRRTFCAARGNFGTEREAVAIAADRAQRFALNLPGMADLSVEHVVESVRYLTLAYPAQAPAEVLGHIVSAQKTSLAYSSSHSAQVTAAGNTSTVWLPASEARACGQLGNVHEALLGIERAHAAWDTVRHDELDELGGIATFSRSRQLYYAGPQPAGAQRIGGIIKSAQHVHSALVRRQAGGNSTSLREQIEQFTSNPAQALAR